MLRFLIGKELTSQLVSSIEKNISSQLEKTLNDSKGAAPQNKSELEREKLNIEKLKLELEQEKFSFEQNVKFKLEEKKFNLEEAHKEASYKHPAETARQSARIRGRYGSATAIIIAATTGGYLKYVDYRLKEKDKKLREKDANVTKLNEARARMQIYKEEMSQIKGNCEEKFKAIKLTKDFLTQAHECTINNADYKIAKQNALKLQPHIEELEKLSTTPKIGGSS